jgi:hypothetical protein
MFVELPTDNCSVLFNQGETFMLMRPNNLKTAISLGQKIYDLGQKLDDNIKNIFC